MRKWHRSGAHAHNAVLSGFKTQEIGHSRRGSGGYNALIFDDSASQVGARLHTTQATTQLNLGHIKRQHDNERRQSHGHGAEMRTDAHGAIRAGKGLLISADARPNASGAQMDAREAHDQLKQAHELQEQLSGTAQKHNAFTGAALNSDQHKHPDIMLKRMTESLEQTAHGSGTQAGGGAGIVPAFGRPDLVLSAPAGIVLSTPQDLQAVGSAVTVTGAVDVSATLGRNLAVAVKDGISLFTYGDAKAGRAEQGDQGIKLHAAQGKVELQAQSAKLKAAADKDVQVTSTHAKVQAAAKEHVLLAASGAYVKIGGGNIEIHAPGKVEFKAAMKELSGPANRSIPMPLFPKSEVNNTHLYSQRVDISQLMFPDEDFALVPYKVQLSDGRVFEGITDQDGRTARIHGTSANEAKIIFGDGEWSLELDADHQDDSTNAP